MKSESKNFLFQSKFVYFLFFCARHRPARYVHYCSCILIHTVNHIIPLKYVRKNEDSLLLLKTEFYSLFWLRRMTLLAAIVGTDVVHIYEIHENFSFILKYNKNANFTEAKMRRGKKEGMWGTFLKIFIGIWSIWGYCHAELWLPKTIVNINGNLLCLKYKVLYVDKNFVAV